MVSRRKGAGQVWRGLVWAQGSGLKPFLCYHELTELLNSEARVSLFPLRWSLCSVSSLFVASPAPAPLPLHER